MEKDEVAGIRFEIEQVLKAKDIQEKVPWTQIYESYLTSLPNFNNSREVLSHPSFLPLLGGEMVVTEGGFGYFDESVDNHMRGQGVLFSGDDDFYQGWWAKECFFGACFHKRTEKTFIFYGCGKSALLPKHFYEEQICYKVKIDENSVEEEFAETFRLTNQFSPNLNRFCLEIADDHAFVIFKF